jgi:hypothetical protein
VPGPWYVAFFDVSQRLIPDKAFVTADARNRQPMVLRAEIYEGRMDLPEGRTATAMESVRGPRLDGFDMTIKNLKFNLHNVEGQVRGG